MKNTWPLSTPWPDVPRPGNYRFLFRRQVACILKWRSKRSVEGSQNLSEDVSAIVCLVLWLEASIHPHEEIKCVLAIEGIGHPQTYHVDPNLECHPSGPGHSENTSQGGICNSTKEPESSPCQSQSPIHPSARTSRSEL